MEPVSITAALGVAAMLVKGARWLNHQLKEHDYYAEVAITKELTAKISAASRRCTDLGMPVEQWEALHKALEAPLAKAEKECNRTKGLGRTALSLRWGRPALVHLLNEFQLFTSQRDLQTSLEDINAQKVQRAEFKRTTCIQTIPDWNVTRNLEEEPQPTSTRKKKRAALGGSQPAAAEERPKTVATAASQDTGLASTPPDCLTPAPTHRQIMTLLEGRMIDVALDSVRSAELSLATLRQAIAVLVGEVNAALVIDHFEALLILASQSETLEDAAKAVKIKSYWETLGNFNQQLYTMIPGLLDKAPADEGAGCRMTSQSSQIQPIHESEGGLDLLEGLRVCEELVDSETRGDCSGSDEDEA